MSSIVIAGDTSGSVTLQAPAVAGSSVLSLPAVTDTVAGIAATQTLTNKSIVATQLTGTIAAARLPAGSVLQVVSVTYGTGASISSTSFTDTGLTASITPSSASNKVLVIVSNNAISQTQTTANRQYSLIIVRGATTLLTKYWSSYAPTVDGYSEISIDGSMLYLDSPATTSSTTYKIQGKVNNTASSTQLKLNSDGSAQSTITLMEISA
jgi:hypothetical protein